MRVTQAQVRFSVERQTYDEMVAAALTVLYDLGFPDAYIDIDIAPARLITSMGSQDPVREWGAEVRASVWFNPPENIIEEEPSE